MKNIYILLGLILLNACTTNPIYVTKEKERTKPLSQKSRFYGKHPDRLDHTIDYPKENRNQFYAICSFYGKKFHGRPTANGETYDMNKMSCAHKSLPFGTILKITDKETNKSIEVRVNDRGPFIKNRDLDLSQKAAKEIGLVGAGVKEYYVEVIRRGDE